MLSRVIDWNSCLLSLELPGKETTYRVELGRLSSITINKRPMCQVVH